MLCHDICSMLVVFTEEFSDFPTEWLLCLKRCLQESFPKRYGHGMFFFSCAGLTQSSSIPAGRIAPRCQAPMGSEFRRLGLQHLAIHLGFIFFVAKSFGFQSSNLSKLCFSGQSQLSCLSRVWFCGQARLVKSF